MSPVCEPARLRWAVHTTSWAPGPPEWEFLLALLPDEGERQHCERFRGAEDRKHALVSRLLQRRAAAAALGLAPGQVVCRRTRGGKPYVAAPPPRPHAPNWNYSVSHEGDYVVLGAEPVCICGCDVAAPRSLQRRPGQPPQPTADFLRPFQRQFTPREQSSILCAGEEAAQQERFRQFWSLKEAFVKANGQGLGFDLGAIEFDICGSTATVSVHGVPQTDWAFHLHELGQGHWVSVARAPLSAVVDAWGGFKATFERTTFSQAEWQQQLQAPEPAFELLTVADLVPDDLRAEYEAAGGDLL